MTPASHYHMERAGNPGSNPGGRTIYVWRTRGIQVVPDCSLCLKYSVSSESRTLASLWSRVSGVAGILWVSVSASPVRYLLGSLPACWIRPISVLVRICDGGRMHRCPFE